MYLRKIHVRGVKLLRDVEIDFTGADGNPRPFTVFVGENGMCKTSLLQAIALAASGAPRANQLAEAASYLDVRNPEGRALIQAKFSFSQARHAKRAYPGIEKSRPPSTPGLFAWLTVLPDFDVFNGNSFYDDSSDVRMPFDPEFARPPRGSVYDRVKLLDPLSDARGRNLPDWFVAAYGVSRTLPVPASVQPDEIASPSRDRLLSLFKATRIIGTGFADLLPPERADAFAAHLQEAFVKHGILPHATALSLRARGNIPRAADRLKAHRLTLAFRGHAVDVPTTWLSQGYQAMMAWVADLVGQIWWEAEKQEVSLAEMEGICLVDEIDLHLHPRWQAGVVRALRAVFPRIQFIATTHSPMVLPGLRQDEIFLMEPDEEGSVVVRPATDAPARMTGSELYRRFFGIERAQPRELHDKLFEYATLASYPGRSEAEEQRVWKLLAELRAAGVEPDFEPEARQIKPPRKKTPAPKRSKSKRRE